MCGIAGLVGIKNAQDKIASMTNALRHRGPDGEGFWQSKSGHVTLGHRRLAVIDLTDAASQPMIDEKAGIALVFNGEIYNFIELRRELQDAGFIFKGHGDSEVLLRGYQQWGPKVLDRISGMFAFGIVDEKRNELLLVRDRCGQKPLYYFKGLHGFAFASEIKALFAANLVERHIDKNGLQDYLAYGYTLGPYTLVEGVCKVMPGEAITINLDALSIRKRLYWQPPTCESPLSSLAEAESKLADLLRDSVRRHLIADVPIGILLSGGLDSSLITAMASEVSERKVKTYTVIFPGHKNHDESAYARSIADHFGTEHTELDIEDSGPEIMEVIARQCDDLIADHAVVPTYLLARRIRTEVTVALSGDGGDELFGGYPHYEWISRQASIRKYLPSWLRKGLSRSVQSMLPPGVRGRNHAIGMAGDITNAIAHVNLYFDATTRARLLDGHFANVNTTPESRKADIARVRDVPLEQVLLSDFRTTLAEGYLTKVDRASMLASLETRAPWLDDNLVDFAWRAVPTIMKVKNGEKKVLPRRLAKGLFPAMALQPRKQGFTMPLSTWFKGKWGEYFKDVLLDSGQDFLSKRVIEDLFRLQQRGRANQNRIYALTMLALWRTEYTMTL